MSEHKFMLGTHSVKVKRLLWVNGVCVSWTGGGGGPLGFVSMLKMLSAVHVCMYVLLVNRNRACNYTDYL